ncbi:MAG: hypothetical protein AB1391_01245 [Candidatus Micrarchaeota archaeon]
MLFMILFAFSFSFASGWQELSVIAITISIMILGLIFAAGHIIDSNEMKFLAKDELVQIVATALMLASIAAFATFLSSISADASLSIDNSLQTISSMNNILGGAAETVGKEGSRSIWCSFSAVSFGTSACTGYRMLSPSLSIGFQLTGTALAELNAFKFLMDSSNTWIINLFLPLGIFLRTFKYTRGAGSLFMATAVAFCFVLPITYTVIQDSIESFRAANPNFGAMPSFSISSCNEYAIDDSQNEQNAINAFNGAIASAFPQLLFAFLIDANLTIIVSLAVTISSIRFLMGIAGAEIDVQSLGRLI